MTAPRVITEELGGSRISRDAQAGALPQWYRARPHGESGWRAYLEEVARAHQTGTWLAELNGALQATGRAAERITRAAQKGGVVVSTGQQSGLFGGPIYTLSKALSARALADTIDQ